MAHESSFPAARGGRLSADAVQYLVAKYAAAAQQTCSIISRASVFRRMCFATPPRWNCCRPAWTGLVIALWLGHESVETTQIYLDADLAIKEEAPFQNHADQRQSGPLPARR